MSQRLVTVNPDHSVSYTGLVGALGGLVGGFSMGIVFHFGANLMPFVGALYGWPTVLGGWAVHLINSVFAGVLFAFLLAQPVFRKQTETLADSVAAGVIYAAAVGLVSTGLLLPISMNMLGVQSLPEPLLPLPGILGSLLVVASVGVAHLVYGVVLGATYAAVHSQTGTATPFVEHSSE